MLKIFLLISYFLSFNNLFSIESNNSSAANPSEDSSLIKQKQLDYFVIRFEVDEQDEEQFKKIFRQKKHEGFQDEEFSWGPGNYIVFRTYFRDEVEDTVTFFCLKNINFIANEDIAIPISSEFNTISINFKSKKENITHALGFKKAKIMPGKKYIIKFKNLLFFPTPEELNSGGYSNREKMQKVEIEIEIQDIQENQLKVKNVLNEVLDTVPTDINNLISEYIV